VSFFYTIISIIIENTENMKYNTYTANFNYQQMILKILIAAVWFVNGFFCKILNLVPRHQQIVADILSVEYAQEITVMIGSAEVLMAVWVLSQLYSRLNVILQIVLVITMNIIEYTLVPELLLWGEVNIVFAILFIGLVYYSEYSFSQAFKNEHYDFK